MTDQPKSVRAPSDKQLAIKVIKTCVDALEKLDHRAQRTALRYRWDTMALDWTKYV